MKTTERFERAVTKLYTAFHNDELDGYDCSHCAVGNMCDNNPAWSNTVPNTSDILRSMFQEGNFKNTTGYSLQELSRIEAIFLIYCPYKHDKEAQFKGLCAVVEYLCELDGIPNVMDYSSLFDYNDKGAKKELKEVFQWKTT